MSCLPEVNLGGEGLFANAERNPYSHSNAIMTVRTSWFWLHEQVTESSNMYKSCPAPARQGDDMRLEL